MSNETEPRQMKLVLSTLVTSTFTVVNVGDGYEFYIQGEPNKHTFVNSGNTGDLDEELLTNLSRTARGLTFKRIAATAQAEAPAPLPTKPTGALN